MVGFKNGKLEKKSLIVLYIVVIITAFALNQLDFFEPLDYIWNDFNSRNFSIYPENYENKVVYVIIRQNSIDRFVQSQNIGWPWPREIYTYLIDYLLSGGVESVTFDFIFSESSVYGYSDDSVFFHSLEKNMGKVYTGILFSTTGNDKPVENIKMGSIGKDFHNSYLTHYQSYLPFPEPFDSLNLRFGNIAYSEDKDGINRRVNPVISYKNYLFPFLALLPASAHEKSDIILENGVVKVGNKKIRLSKNGDVLLKYYSSFYDYPYYDIMDLFESYGAIQAGSDTSYNAFVSPSVFKGKHVFIGSDAPGLRDLRPNPFSKRDPGVHIYGVFLDNFIHQDFLIIWDSFFFQLFLILSFSFISIYIAILPGTVKSSIFFILGLLSIFVLNVILFRFYNLVFHSSILLFCYGFSFILVSSILFYENKHQKKILQSAFSQLISPVVMDKILENPDLIHLGGEIKEVTLFFSDIQGFTGISEKISPSKLIEILNIYLNEVSKIIIDDHQGYIDKYIGDAVMAVWGAPLDQPDHADLAVIAALECVKAIDQINLKLKEKGFSEQLNFRIGISSGNAVMGMMGSDRKKNYTALGDTVNFASRLEGINKYYGTNILLGENTIRLLQRKIQYRKIDMVKVKGKQESISIYEPTDMAADKKMLFEVYSQGLALYEKGEFQKAKIFFEKVKMIDTVSSVFFDRCEYLIKTPPLNWDGVYEFKTK